MTPVLNLVSSYMLALGMLGLVAGGFIAAFIGVRVAFSQPDFWDKQWAGLQERMEFRSRIGQISREKENTTREGSVADWMLKRATFLMIAGGMLKGILFLIERQST